MPGGYGEADIYMVERTEAGWSEPKNLGPEINTERIEMFPFIQESGVLYFSSNRHSGMGGLDIYKAEIKNGLYSVENMGYPMNSNSEDFSLIIDKDQKEGYFSSNREGGKGDDDIYKFTALKINLNLQGKFYNQETKQHIKNASIVLKNNEGEQERLISSSDEFDYRIEVDPNKEYTIQVNKDGYDAFQATFIPSELYPQDNIVNSDVFLKKIPFWGIYGNVYLLPDMTYVPEVIINVEPRNGEKFTVLSSKLGDFNTLAQSETQKNTLNPAKLIVSGKGTNIINNPSLENRAKRKAISRKMLLCLIDVAKEKGATERVQHYWNAYHCLNSVVISGNKMYGKYFKTRFCTVCSAI